MFSLVLCHVVYERCTLHRTQNYKSDPTAEGFSQPQCWWRDVSLLCGIYFNLMFKFAPKQSGNQMNLTSSCLICSAYKVLLPSYTKRFMPGARWTD